MPDEVKAMRDEGPLTDRGLGARVRPNKEYRGEVQPMCGPTPDELITRYADGASDWAEGLRSIRSAVYGMDPGVRERAEKVLAELLSCHAARFGGPGAQMAVMGRPY